MDQTPTPQAVYKRKQTWTFALLIMAVVFLVATAVVLAYKIYSSAPKVPARITQKMDFPAYLPRKLPGSYKIVDDSFSFSEGTLIFNVKDSSGATIAFTEQKRPAKIDFESFYKANLSDAKTLSDVPYPSVSGKLTGDRTLLSIVTDKTWIMVSSTLSLDQDALQKIAANMK